MAETQPQDMGRLKFSPTLQIGDLKPEHHPGDWPGTAPTGSVQVGIPPAQKVYYEVESVRGDKEGRCFCIPPSLNLDLYIEEESGRKAWPRGLVDMPKLPQAASEGLIHDLWRTELGKWVSQLREAQQLWWSFSTGLLTLGFRKL